MPAPDTLPPLLYSYRRCPYAMRARMTLLQAGRAFRVFEVVLRDKPAELLRLSPKGTVPVLQLADGRVLEQSWDIMRWALEPADTDGWWRRAQTEANLALLACNDGEFKRWLDRYKYPERYAAEALDREAARAAAVQALLLPLQHRLEARPWLGGDTPCATDLALFPFVRQFAAIDPAWFEAQPWPALRAWLSGWLAAPLFQACMVKLPAQTSVPFPMPSFRSPAPD
ncbi:glutathione S-transferase [Roseateles sp. DAIF2]|uniref:glutathione S-transferase N-terminal domain-containing protein n=1 Tax=Roseateles sp. DAIF2 TaxID=2714952 RepID=UPI0018A28C0B|nr:glutathione S-transferase N-terminal domain-containing protein [Roseateles sp. DAIF2]QPF72375.1 glutathione S-transferase [Roseateles sp. DAIF2]